MAYDQARPAHLRGDDYGQAKKDKPTPKPRLLPSKLKQEKQQSEEVKSDRTADSAPAEDPIQTASGK